MSDNNSNKSENHTTRIITIIISLGTALIGAPTLYNVISDIFFTPTISMEFLPDHDTKNNITLEVKNIGNEAATNYLLTVKSPLKVSNYNLFITENSTNIKKSLLDQKTLQISIPRLVQGPGSLIMLDLFLNSPTNITDKFIAYSTFDQGSSKKEVSFADDKEPLSFNDKFEEFLGKYLSSTSIGGIISTITAIIIGISTIYFIQIFREKTKRSSSRTER